MENNKYYTPEIEEFRVGFEYEYLGDRVENTRWHKTTFSWYDSKIKVHGLFFVESKIQNKTVRVKYLDSQDIEELGFKYIPDLSEGDGNVRWYDLYEKGNISLLHWDYSNEDTKIVIKRNNSIIFEGTILNKSELKWILTRIGVL